MSEAIFSKSDGSWPFIPNAADRLLDRIDSVIAMLAEHPMAGRARPELGPGSRSFPIGSYIVFYHYDDGDVVEVVRVLGGCLDFSDDDFF